MARVFVSHHQLQVAAGWEARIGNLALYTVGDRLVHRTGRNELTVLTGPHTGEVEVAVQVLTEPPGPDADEWDAVSEATLWCPDGRITVRGLMGDCPDEFADIPVGRPGLLRVRARARDRHYEDVPAPPGRPEQHEIVVWPVDEDLGHVTTRADQVAGFEWPDRPPGRAATWALSSLAALAAPDPREEALRRFAAPRGAQVDESVVTVRRNRDVPAGIAADVVREAAHRFGFLVSADVLVLPVGDLAVRLTPARPAGGTAFAAEWRWIAGSGQVPDPRPSQVAIEAGLHGLTVVHRDVPASHAVLLGLVWDYLLDRAIAGWTAPLPWLAEFAAREAESAAKAEALRQSKERSLARTWGGKVPSERVRRLPANAWALSNLDRELLDALADAPPVEQRVVARWAARQACAIAGLAGIDWIAAGLDALDGDGPLPPPFDQPERAWERLWSDPRVPQTVVTTPTGTPNASRQAMAFPVVTAAAHEDPLAAAVDTLVAALSAHGAPYDVVTSACRARFPGLAPG
ncbi:hypothetical protein O7635_08130 [Asanoa sp. WMMD1127]|uniref:hypothetical protein n=1 Tax=Asanoa sp. WMMD1127 TaxID=3016107 RepID=UPI002416F4C5|nr:hypothetical protein [Asanoa sp. WMMD1127]MDG4821820.1 hypothetical protein [Asanoa sp. WMMD1127]